MAGEEEQEAAAEAAEAFLTEDLPENVFGSVKAGAGMWASCLRIMHPTEVSSANYSLRGGGQHFPLLPPLLLKIRTLKDLMSLASTPSLTITY